MRRFGLGMGARAGWAGLSLALGAFAAPAEGHIIYATSFEPGQGFPGPLPGQDLWQGTTGPAAWRVTNADSYFGFHSVVYNALNGPQAEAYRQTAHIQLDPIPGWVVLRLEGYFKLEGLRPDATSSFRFWSVNEVPGGLLQVGIDNGRMVATSGLSNAPLLVGPAVPLGQWNYLVAEMDMYTGAVTAMLNDVPFGGFQLSIPEIESLESSTGMSFTASVSGGTGPATERLYMDSLRIWHTPSPGSLWTLAAAGAWGMRRRRTSARRAPHRLLLGATIALAPGTALAQPGGVDPVSGLQFVRITHPGNPAYSGFDPFGYTTGRGSVGYEYSIARTEVSTGQWLEFFNTFLTREQPVPWLRAPFDWGAEPDPAYTGPGTRYRLRSIANAADVGAYAITWRTAAMYCNWLHNGKGTDLASIQSGAYDVSTFTNLPNGQWTDQLTRSEGARYWIPSLDEWLKAAHWDPANPSNGGWWTYANGSETPATYGPPPSFGGDGTGQANAGFQLPNFAHYDIPLGSYPNTPSVWGLLDLMGMGSEWTEGILHADPPFGDSRIFEGSRAGGIGHDRVYGLGGSQYPYSPAGDFNLRIASSIPSPGTLGIPALCVLLGWHRRRTPCAVPSCQSS